MLDRRMPWLVRTEEKALAEHCALDVLDSVTAFGERWLLRLMAVSS